MSRRGSTSFPAARRPHRPIERAGLLWLSCLVAGLIACAGCRFYQVGNRELFRPDIQTIYVDIFEADTFRKFLGQRLTEAVAKEIELNTPLRIAERGLAQSILRGRIVRERKRVVAETVNDDPRDLQIDYQIEITWTNPVGVPLAEPQIIRLGRSIDFVPEGGQSLATAEQELIRRLARQIVQQLEMPW
jgi:hypothetical protein